jgi:hypothetical protein
MPTGPSCLCGHFDDCPACHEPNYDRHMVLKHLSEMTVEARRACVAGLFSAMNLGVEATSTLQRLSHLEEIRVSFKP